MKISLSEIQLRKLIDEALRDEIPGYMKDIISKRYPKKYLDMDVPKHTDVIPNVMVEVEDQNITNKTIKELVEYFTNNIIVQFKKTVIYNSIKSNDTLKKLIGLSLGRNVSLDNISDATWLYSKEFKLPIGKDNDINNPKFSNNKSGIGNFLKSCARAFSELSNLNTESIINDKHFVGLREPIINYQTNIKNIKDSKLYLYITDKPDDKLRMSISLFYDSCQNIYTGGDEGTQYNKKLLSNVFDENSKVAYLMFNTPFSDKRGNKHPYSSIARTILRVNDKGGVMFDRVYPGDMKDMFYQIIEDKTGLKNTGKKNDIYHYKGIGLPLPYMDMYNIKNTGQKNYDDKVNRIAALRQVINFNKKDFHELGEGYYNVNGEDWRVFTHDEAIEATRDYWRDSFYDFFHETDLEDICDTEILDKDLVFSILGIDEDELEEEGYNNPFEYVDDVLGIKTLSDFNDILKNRVDSSYWRWYPQHINIDNTLDFYGEWESMRTALAFYDGELHEIGNFIVFRYE